MSRSMAAVCGEDIFGLTVVVYPIGTACIVEISVTAYSVTGQLAGELSENEVLCSMVAIAEAARFAILWEVIRKSV